MEVQGQLRSTVESPECFVNIVTPKQPLGNWILLTLTHRWKAIWGHRGQSIKKVMYIFTIVSTRNLWFYVEVKCGSRSVFENHAFNVYTVNVLIILWEVHWGMTIQPVDLLVCSLNKRLKEFVQGCTVVMYVCVFGMWKGEMRLWIISFKVEPFSRIDGNCWQAWRAESYI